MSDLAAASDLAPAAPAPAPAPAWMPVGSPEAAAARGRIDELKFDKAFYARLQQQDPAARAEWDGLHKTGFSAAEQVTSQADVDSQAAARREQEWSGYFAALSPVASFIADQQEEICGGVTGETSHQEAVAEKKG